MMIITWNFQMIIYLYVLSMAEKLDSSFSSDS